MNKRTRLMIAGLMLIAVTGASTLAYFTSTVQLNGTNGSDLKLQITNGKVEIESAYGRGLEPVWTYDVAEGGTDKDRSPDITDFEAVKTSSAGIERVPIGAILKGNTISNARPGDALVLSLNVDNDGDKIADSTAIGKGIKIRNNSNLTTKILVKKSTDANTEVQKLFNAGWIMKINGVKVTSTSELDTQLNSVNNDLTNKLKTQGSEAEIEIRLELPLTTDNTYQNSEISAGSEFNIAGLFTIVATQENNPNWNEAGTP